MTSEQWVEIFKPLGAALPLVMLLFWLLRENISERKQMTSEFLTALRDTLKTASEATIRSSESMDVLADTVRDTTARHSSEHERILDALIFEKNRIQDKRSPRDAA